MKSQGPATEVTVFNIKLQQNLLTINTPRLGMFESALAADPNEFVRSGILSYVRTVNGAQADVLEA